MSASYPHVWDESLRIAHEHRTCKATSSCYPRFVFGGSLHDRWRHTVTAAGHLQVTALLRGLLHGAARDDSAMKPRQATGTGPLSRWRCGLSSLIHISFFHICMSFHTYMPCIPSHCPSRSLDSTSTGKREYIQTQGGESCTRTPQPCHQLHAAKSRTL